MEVQNVTASRPVAGMIWRWRTELGSAATGTAGYLECAHCLGLVPAGVVAGASAVIAGVLPWPRRFLAGRFRCVLSRHRLQTVFWELRLHTRSSHIPLVLWIRPTPVGERAWIMARAGLCADDFTTHTAEIASACVAREARVSGSRRFSPLITIDVIRRDVLGPARAVRSPLADLPAITVEAVPEPAPRPAWPALPVLED